jgi:uncharacterized protein (DUF1800 family)
VIGILAAHPSTARWISRKLAVRFVSDNPPDALVERMASAFRRSGGDIPAVLRSMFDSKEFWSEAAYRAKLKSPFEMVVSAARAMDAEVDKTQALARALARLGQPLYRKAEPTGYSGKEEEWANSASLLARFNFAQALASNRVAGVQVDPARTPQVPGISAETRAAAAKAGPGGAAAILLASPEFQRR